MPYISEVSRQEIEAEIDAGTLKVGSLTAGELNYLFTIAIDEYLKDAGVTYDNINKVIGVLECAKLELYRRIAAPYEDKKIEVNGDVYTCQK